MIDQLSKLREIYNWFNEAVAPCAVDGFDDFELVGLLKREPLEIPLNSFDEFIRFVYKNSPNLDVDKIPNLMKMVPYLFSEKQIFIIKKPAQVGASTFFLQLIAYYFLKYRLPVMYIAVDSGVCNIIQSQLVSFLNSLGVKVLMKEPDFVLTNYGVIYFAYSTSADSFRSKPAAFVFIDEASGMRPNIGGEGDVISLALARTGTFSNIRKIFVFSTPTDDNSFLEKYFPKADKLFVYKVQCPICEFRFEPAVNDIVDKYHIKCQNCHNAINRIDAINLGGWDCIDRDNPSDIWSFRFNAITSPLTDLLDIQYRYKIAMNDMFALRSFLNLVMAEEYKMNESGFPMPRLGTMDIEENDIILYAADPHQSDVHVVEVVFKPSGFAYMSDARIMSHGEYMDWLNTVPACIIDVGFFSHFDIASLPSDVRNKLVAVKGANRQEVVGRLVLFLRKKYIGLNLIYRQDVLMRMYRMAMEQRIVINENINRDFLMQIKTGFNKMSVQFNKRTGKYYWCIPEEFHEYTHFIDCLLYAIAIYEHYKYNENFVEFFTKRIAKDVGKRHERSNEKINIMPIAVL